MTVFILERVPAGLRGELTRWLLEPRAGVFVGTIPASVRERLWTKACDRKRDGSAVVIHRAETEQGFAFRVCGEPKRRVVDFDGLQLIKLTQ